ncbi:MAG: NAD(P)-dependent oxidoreductase [Alphaproteobacteria bacterium]|nr:NAD(P)-dependent oxidoreductase [Alphaproteobacteria bacterium]
MNPRTIAILGLGEAGTALARGLRQETSWGTAGGSLVAVDIGLGDGARGRAMAERARGFGVALAGRYSDALTAADLVFSVVTGDEAASAARSARPLLRPGTVFLDLNTVTREMARVTDREFNGTGIVYVDVAVMGMFHANGYRVPMLLAGPAAPCLLDWLGGEGFSAKVLNDRPGDASAVKMLRSVLMKGLEALSVECLVAAEAQGLREEVLDCLADFDRLRFRDAVSNLVCTHLVHGERRLAEMEKVRRTLIETGVAPLMTGATCQNHARTLAHGVLRPGGPVPTLTEALAALAPVAAGPRQ